MNLLPTTREADGEAPAFSQGSSGTLRTKGHAPEMMGRKSFTGSAFSSLVELEEFKGTPITEGILS